MVRKTNIGNRKELPERKGLRVGKCGAPDAQRRRAHIQKEEVTKCYKK